MNSETKTVKPIHGAPRPVNVPEDMQPEPPEACQFKVGDAVIYTNEQGVSFRRIVRGFAREPFQNRFVYLNNIAWWFPVNPGQLRIDDGPPAAPARPWYSPRQNGGAT